jgi:hypothetical protein
MRDLLEQDVTEEYMLIDGKQSKVLARRGHKPGLAPSPVRLARADSAGMNFWIVVKTTPPPATRSFSRKSTRSAAWT